MVAIVGHRGNQGNRLTTLSGLLIYRLTQIQVAQNSMETIRSIDNLQKR